MSRGLGGKQRAILDALETRLGGDQIEDHRGYRAWLTFGTHDLRRVSREMAKTMGGISHCNYASESWQSSFSRAIAGLAKMRMIEILWLVPLRGIEPEFEIPTTELASDLYLTWFSRQRRFIGIRQNFITLNKARAYERGASALY